MVYTRTRFCYHHCYTAMMITDVTDKYTHLTFIYFASKCHVPPVVNVPQFRQGLSSEKGKHYCPLGYKWRVKLRLVFGHGRHIVSVQHRYMSAFILDLVRIDLFRMKVKCEGFLCLFWQLFLFSAFFYSFWIKLIFRSWRIDSLNNLYCEIEIHQRHLLLLE